MNRLRADFAGDIGPRVSEAAGAQLQASAAGAEAGVSSSASPRPIALSVRGVAALLSSILGWEKSEELVRRVAVEKGIDTSALTSEDALAILESLSTRQGLVGLTARGARSRVEPLALRGSRKGRGVSRPPSVAARSLGSTDPLRLPLDEIASLLAPTLGEEAAIEVVVSAVEQSRIEDEHLTREQALVVFEVLGGRQGLVGVTARFAKSRLLLRYSG